MISSLIKKIVMALTGLALIGFLLTHLLGNLLLFKGAETFNHYSHALITNPLIIVAELGLLAFFVSHAISGIHFTFINKQARPQGYYKNNSVKNKSRRSVASLTMIFSGLFLILFVVIHLSTFKYGPHYQVVSEPAVRDLHKLVLEEFKEPLEVVFYVVSMILIGGHLWHGFGSAFESLGVRYRPWVRGFGKVLAVIIAAGFAVIPVYVYFCK